jgi:hypothetical protein
MPSNKRIIRENLAETNRLIAESENSPYNEAKVSKENMDYYSKTLADYAKSKREAEYGLSPEETAAARQGFAESTNLGVQNAQNAGGNTLAKYINANVNSNASKFETGLAAQDAEIKRQKQQQSLAYLNQLGQASSISQGVASQNFEKQMMAEQALGQAKSDWVKANLQRKQQNREMAVSIFGSVLGAGAKVASAGMTAGMIGGATPAIKK